MLQADLWANGYSGCAPQRSFTDFTSGSRAINISALRFFRQTLAEELHTNSWRTVLVSCLLPPASCLLLTASCLLLTALLLFPVSGAETGLHLESNACWPEALLSYRCPHRFPPPAACR